jgi:hypothetical protein
MPSSFKQTVQNTNLSTQTITTTTETVIATLAGVTNWSPGAPVILAGYAFFAINASTTSTTLRIRSGSLSGAVIGAQAAVLAETAGTISQAPLEIATVDNVTGEYGSQTYVLTIQAAAAAANWNVTIAQLTATS